MTIADIAVAAPMHLHKASRLPVDQHPNLKRWMTQIEKLPAWQKTQGTYYPTGRISGNPNLYKLDF